ncbi:lysophospholipid acyltransferase family protein [Nocardioides aestuarii]|uniref:Lysophospholipid acyltransferase family protein n=1 Tax=Nocardioides aestuarii TaxID=252231 RepID=A0ABW4TP08_9ACTN
MSREPWYDLTVLLGSALFRAIDLRLDVEGVEHVPTAGPAVIAANHVGFLDFMTIAAAGRERGRNVRFLCRHDVWTSRVARRAMTGMRHVPVDRAAPAAAYLAARRLLREGEVVAVFPEAGISHSFTIRSLMVGAAALARETGAPLVPAVQWGTQLVASPGRRPSAHRGRPVDLRFSPPVDVPAGADLRAVTDTLGHALTRDLEDLQRRQHHVPARGSDAWWYPAHLGGAAPDRVASAPKDVVPRSAVTPTWGPGV